MKPDISEIKSSPNVFIFADKNSNIYKAALQEYNKPLTDNIAKSYKKSTDRLEKAINMEYKFLLLSALVNFDSYLIDYVRSYFT